jgi:uncharacterized protein with ATP-grasp and redox domains
VRPLHTGEPGSFAHETFRVRIPEILRKTRAQLGPVPPSIDGALDELDAEVRTGRLRLLREEAADRAFWDGAAAPHVGHTWLDLPWFFAETFFYRRLLEATGYFSGGAMAGRDPFAADKNAEWAPDEAPARCAQLLSALPAEAGARLRALLLGSLWGNRADLSYNVALQLGSYAGDPTADLLVDHGPAVVERVLRHECRHVTVIGDNAGTELAMDLALIDHLFACGVERVVLHLKDHPMFVSDAMAADLDAGLAALGSGATAPLAARIAGLRQAGRLQVGTHWFYTKSLFYPELPADLRATLAAEDLVILKGDANYRRLCSDSRWPPETPFADVVKTFPAPLVTLRTLKAEVIVGLPPGVAERLQEVDPGWMVNGRRGVIQARL